MTDGGARSDGAFARQTWLSAAIADLVATRESPAPSTPGASDVAADTLFDGSRTRPRGSRLGGRAATAQRSLFGEILDWMLAPLLLLWPLSVAITFLFARSLADAPFDRVLQDRAVVLAQQVRFVEDQTLLSLPRAARELLSPEQGKQVLFQVVDPRGEVVAGDAALPRPSIYDFPEPGRVKVRSARHRGVEIRVGYTYIGVRGGEELGLPVLVQVAETLEERSRLANEIIKGVIFPQFVILPLAVALVWFGLSRGLKPLKSMQRRIRARAPEDLSPIDPREAPEEISPLVGAFNDMLSRLTRTMARQRRFVADAAHQMKTPLAGLRTQAELALRQTDPDELRSTLTQLERSSTRTAHLVNQLLALARAENQREMLAREPVDVEALVRDVVAELAPQALARHMDVGFESANTPAFVRGAPLLLHELVANLVDNALQYAGDGGVVTARVKVAGATVTIEVEDNGPGVPATDRDLIFDRFYRVLGGPSDGSGLGLAIVHEIAEQHGARIEVGDGLPWPAGRGQGFGAAFVVLLARAEVPAPGASGSTSP